MGLVRGRQEMAIAFGMALATVALPAQAQQSDGYTFLKAVKEKDGTVVTDMLSQPGSTIVNARDITTGENALHIAVRRRDSTWIKFLAGKGANPNQADRNGVTPLVLATNLGFVEGVEDLIAVGAAVDQANSAGETPLISAVHRRNGALLRMLIAAGANPDRPDNSGRSARDYAALDGPSSQMLKEIERAATTDKRQAGATYGPAL